MMLKIAAFLAAAGLSWLLTAATRRYAIRRNMLDHPGERSSHQLSTPRGGGLAIVACFLLALSMLWLTGHLPTATALGLGGAGVLTAAVGFADDHGDLSIRGRLSAHALAAAWGLYWLAPEWLFAAAHAYGVWSWLLWLAMLLVLVWILNLYNFMDGIDGIAAMETIFVALAALVIWPGHQAQGMRMLLLVLAGAAAGFLIWNWAPAKIFMGDVGSAFLGLVLALCGFSASSLDGPSPWCWLVLLGAFFADATLTLSRRVLRGDRWWQAHRSHAYQRLARRWESHAQVTLSLLAVNLVWLFPLAWLTVREAALGPLIALLAVLPLMAVAWYLGAGLPDEAEA